MVTKNDLPRPQRDKIEQVDQAQVYAYDENANEYVPLAVNADGELEVDASTGGAIDVSDRDGRDLGNVDVIASPLTAAFKKNAGDPLMVEHDGVIDISSRDGRNLGSVDVSESPLDAALKSNDTDTLVVEAAGTLPTEQQSPVGVEDSGGAQVDPATSADVTGEQPRETRSTKLDGLTADQLTVAASGSPVDLNDGGGSITVPNGATLRVKGLPSNSGNAYVGPAGVTTGTGYPLAAGEETTLDVSDVASVYVDVDTGGEGVAWVVEQ